MVREELFLFDFPVLHLPCQATRFDKNCVLVDVTFGNESLPKRSNRPSSAQEPDYAVRQDRQKQKYAEVDQLR